MRRVEQAYLLQCHAIKEADARLTLLCEYSGLVSGVVKNAYLRKNKSRSLRASLQPGYLLEVSFQLRPGLATIYDVDMLGAAVQLSPKALVLMSYLQELLLYLLPEDAEADFIFPAYQKALQHCITDSAVLEQVLREFEWQLLEHIGIGFDWLHCLQTGAEIEPEKQYAFCGSGQQGFAETQTVGINGADVLAMAEGDFSNPQTALAAKAIFRQVLASQLNGRPLRSRAMYQQLFSQR